MCRWNAYFGQPVMLDELLFKTEHGLIDQSLHSRMGVETTNGDGFGLGWYGPDGAGPARYRSVTPAWSDVNLRELAAQVESPLFLAHIRATTGTPVQQTNCHPFRHGRWLFVHNGLHRGFHAHAPRAADGGRARAVRRHRGLDRLRGAVLPRADVRARGGPARRLERAVGFVEATGRAHGIEDPVQMTVGISDGERLWAVRYSSQHESRTLFVSEDVDALRELHPDNPRLQQLTDEDRVVVSEPLGDLPGAWLEVPESTALIIQPGADEQRPFEPRRQ